jgi:two-component system, cell cycle response regulator
MALRRFEELRHMGQLPSPAGVGLRILQLVQKEEFSLDDLVALIQGDPALTGKLLRAANSPLMGGLSRIASVRDASVRLGTQVVVNLSLGFSIITHERHGRCENFDYDRFWSLSLVHGVAAQALGRACGLASPSHAFTCALLIRVGQLALASTYPAEYATVLSNVRGRPAGALLRAETETFQIDHQEVAAELFSEWGLPQIFGQAAGRWQSVRHDEELADPELRDLISIMRGAEVIAEMCVGGTQPQEFWYPLLANCRLPQALSLEELVELVNRVAFEWMEWGDLLGVPARRLEAFDAGALHAALRASAGSPLEAAPQSVVTASTMPSVSPEGAERMRVLAVDDDPVSLRLLVHHLSRAGFDVVTATDGAEALRVAVDKSPQIVVADWMMPLVDGIELCKQLHAFEAGRRMYIVLLTGRDGDDRVVEAFEAGVDDYVTKPFNPRILLARVSAGQRAVLQRRELELKTKEVERQKNTLSILSRRLEIAAHTDVLTGLSNRRICMERLQEEWQRSLKTALPFSVVLADIDHFKRINDQFGHDAGDQVLREVAAVLSRTTRLEDFCARIGGEEFLVLCRGTDGAGAARFAERLRAAVASQVINTNAFSGQVTFSIGVAQREASMTRPDELLKLADLALYDAKLAGRNRVALRQSDEPPAQSRTA